MIGAPSEVLCSKCARPFVSVVGCDGEPIFATCERCWWDEAPGAFSHRRRPADLLDEAVKQAARLALTADPATVAAMNRDALRAAAEAATRQATAWPSRQVLAKMVLAHLDDDERRRPRPMSRWLVALWVAYFAGVGVLSVSAVRWLLSLL